MSERIITRAEAEALGLKHYFDGTTCSRCDQIDKRSTADGRCMECARRRARAHREADPERSRAQCAAYRAKDAEKKKAARRAYALANADKIAEQGRELRTAKAEHEKARHIAYYAKHLEKCRKTHAAYRAAYPEKVREKHAAYGAAYPEKRAAHCRNRRARARMAEGSHTAEDIQRIYAFQNGKCAICKVKVGKKYHVDHIKALTKGGSNWPATLQILCGPCNARKHNHDPIEHMQSLGFLL